MTAMAIIEKCRERLDEIPQLQKKLSQTEQSARVNARRLENLAKEQAILSQIMAVVNANESSLPQTTPSQPSGVLKENRLSANASVPDLAEICTGKYDLAVVTEYLAGKRASDIGRKYGISCARVLDILDNVKRRCLWYGKRR